jgi:hypothetical protein
VLRLTEVEGPTRVDRGDRGKQGGYPERLDQERGTPVLLCERTDGGVTVTRDDDDGRRVARPAQALLQLKTRESWQVEIENETQRTQDRPDLEVLLGGAKQHRLKALVVQQTTQCVPKGVVIIDDRDDGP